MKIIPIKTRSFIPPKDDIYPELLRVAAKLREKDILLITSKIVAIGEGRCVPMTTEKARRKLIEREATKLAGFTWEKRTMFTIKGNTIIASAGIDDSNSNGHLILWPEDPMRSARDIWRFLRRKSGIKELGIIITDSYCTPMRSGVIGISIGFFGFHPVESHIGKKDIFGRKFTYSKSNIVDAVAAAGVAVMGETTERIPFVIARNVPQVRFTPRDTRRELIIPIKNDIYYPLLKPIYEKYKKKRKRR